MAVADSNGLPVAICTASASPHEVTLVEETLDEFLADDHIDRLVGDKAYDSESLAAKLASDRAIQLIVPPKETNQQRADWGPAEQEIYKHRWKIERLFSWLNHFRRTVVRWEYYVENYRAFVHLASIMILLRHF